MLWRWVARCVRAAGGRLRLAAHDSAIAERMQQFEERLGELEMQVASCRQECDAEAGTGGVEVARDGATGCTEQAVGDAGVDEDETRTACSEALRKARDCGLGGGVTDEAVEEDVRPGRPQSLWGQQARHGAARLWEGVL